MVPKYTPNTGNHPAYNNNSLPSTPYFLKGFKCTFTATNHQGNDLHKTGISEQVWRDEPTLKNEIVNYQYHTKNQQNCEEFESSG